MGTIGQIIHNLCTGEKKPINSGLKEGDSLYTGLTFPDDNPIKKLGIKAPPGTRFMLNDSIFMIGPSGVLNINKLDYYIYKLQLIQEYEVIKNEEQSKKNIENGLKIMDEALSNLINNANVTWINTDLGENKVESIDLTYLITNDGNMPHEELGGIFNTFLVDYTKGYEIYFKGVQGDYSIKLDDNNNPIKKEIYNVIIDYELKEENE